MKASLHWYFQGLCPYGLRPTCRPIAGDGASGFLGQPATIDVQDPGAGETHESQLWGYYADDEFYCAYRRPQFAALHIHAPDGLAMAFVSAAMRYLAGSCAVCAAHAAEQTRKSRCRSFGFCAECPGSEVIGGMSIETGEPQTGQIVLVGSLAISFAMAGFLN